MRSRDAYEPQYRRNGSGEARAAPSSHQTNVEGYAVAGVPLIAGGALVSEIIPVPIELNEWIRGPKFQPILLKVKEQTGINYFNLNVDADDGTVRLWIYSPTADRARMARLLVDVNFKQQIKLAQAEQKLKQMQSDLTSVQSELVTGVRVEFTVPNHLIGVMIGKGGSRVKEVVRETEIKSIDLDGKGKVVIVGTDPENAQRARGLFELFEDSSPLAEEEWLHMSQDFSSLNDLKTSSGLVVARLESHPARIVYIGTRDAISYAKVILSTQLDYLKKRIQLLAEERHMREELYAYRGQQFGGRGRGRGRGSGGRGYGGKVAESSITSPPQKTALTSVDDIDVKDKKSNVPEMKVANGGNGRGPSLRDSLQKLQPAAKAAPPPATRSGNQKVAQVEAVATATEARAVPVGEAASGDVDKKTAVESTDGTSKNSKRQKKAATEPVQDSLATAFSGMAIANDKPAVPDISKEADIAGEGEHESKRRRGKRPPKKTETNAEDQKVSEPSSVVAKVLTHEEKRPQLSKKPTDSLPSGPSEAVAAPAASGAEAAPPKKAYPRRGRSAAKSEEGGSAPPS